MSEKRKTDTEEIAAWVDDEADALDAGGERDLATQYREMAGRLRDHSCGECGEAPAKSGDEIFSEIVAQARSKTAGGLDCQENECLRAKLDAVNEHCTCGGKGPQDEGVCAACQDWHLFDQRKPTHAPSHNKTPIDYSKDGPLWMEVSSHLAPDHDWSEVEDLVRSAEAEHEKYLFCAVQFCGAHIGHVFEDCPACEAERLRGKPPEHPDCKTCEYSLTFQRLYDEAEPIAPLSDDEIERAVKFATPRPLVRITEVLAAVTGGLTVGLGEIPEVLRPHAFEVSAMRQQSEQLWAALEEIRAALQPSDTTFVSEWRCIIDIIDTALTPPKVSDSLGGEQRPSTPEEVLEVADLIDEAREVGAFELDVPEFLGRLRSASETLRRFCSTLPPSKASAPEEESP